MTIPGVRWRGESGLIVNATTDDVLAAQAMRARWFGQRATGLQGTTHLDANAGIWLAPTRQVHTRRLGYPLLVIHCRETGLVILPTILMPGTVGPVVPGTRVVVELSPAVLSRVHRGDHLLWVGF